MKQTEMKSILTLIALIFVASLDKSVNGFRFFRQGREKTLINESEEPSKYERWFTQKLDHFNPNDQRTWQQRYFVNDEFFNGTDRNVAFLLIGGEGEASADWMTNGSWYHYAKDIKPILFQLEHRYYGKSHPTEDLSVENLVYLTSEQALSDLSVFIQSVNIQYELSEDVKWIVFGGSYPGNLAAWLRLKYPHLVHGAMSASGPVLAKLDFPGRQWTYQTCTEFGYFQTSTNKPQIFGDQFELDFFIQQCQDIFGSRYNKTFLDDAIQRTNTFYGGLDIEVDNVVFVHGSLDPWHVLGITETKDNKAPAILIKNAAHCSNMYNPSDNDTPQLKAARVQIKELIDTWLDL